ncbi:MAG TPA: sulfotransferase domain-containing protein [Candidatus Omnitrophota bacterium]|nr:sulfotransferase domain-containing protein [Candidatus Omnitrophota bacterium]
MTMKSPDFIGIGAQRAGTTWLYELLSLHPSIFLPEQKELHFFDEKPDFESYQGIWNPVRPQYHDLASGAEWRWYLARFEEGKNDQLRGEFTPIYATLSEKRVLAISRYLPKVKIIYIIRDPVQRAWSNFRFSWNNHTHGRGPEPSEDVMRKTIFYPAKLVHGDYRRNICVWEKCFRRDSLLYLLYDDIIDRPSAVLDQTCDFLGIARMNVNAARLRDKTNRAPEARMPEGIKSMLEEHFSVQRDFIKEKFGRSLKY